MTQSRDTGEVLNTRGTMGIVDAQTSLTDTTAGRGMLVGAFGLGGERVISNLDTIVETTFGVFASGITGSPFNYGTLVHIQRGADAIQEATSVLTGEKESRFRAGGTWSAWQPVYTGANYQPFTYSGLGHTLVARNISGGSVGAGSSIDGTLLLPVRWSSAGTIETSGTLSTSVWMNKGGFCANNAYSTFTKVAL